MFTYKLSDEIRNRLLYAMQEIIDPGSMPGTVDGFSGFCGFLQDVEARIRHEYGGLHTGRKKVPKETTGFNAIDFFLECTDERALDFIEFFFQSTAYRRAQDGVDIINRILREEGVGYEFSPFADHTDELPADSHYPPGTRSYRHVIDHYPEATKKTSELVHQEVVMPALQLLASPEWQSANDHMMKAHEHLRKGEFRSSITECNAALETTLKIIAQKKGWTYTPDKDALSALVDVLNREKLIYPFYVEVLKNCGTIRNKLGGHGQEPKPSFKAEAEHAEHMIHIASSHILFLAKLAGMR